MELDVLVKFLGTLSDQTISTSDSGTMSNQEQPSPRFVIICDVKNGEACAAARVLCLLMAPRAAHVPRSLPHVLIDCGCPLTDVDDCGIMALPNTVEDAVFMCTGGCFQFPAFLFALLDSTRLKVSAFPVIADGVFVPSSDLYVSIRVTGKQSIQHLPNHIG